MQFLQKIFAGTKSKALILLVLAVIFSLSLVSYNQNDPSFNLATDAPPSNLLSYLGSYLADLLYQILGHAALIIALCFLIWACQLFYYGKITWAIFRFTCMILAVASASLVLNFYPLPYSAVKKGGVLGLGLLHLINNIDYLKYYVKYIPFILAPLSFAFLFAAVDFRCYFYLKTLLYALNTVSASLFRSKLVQKLSHKARSYDDENAYNESAEFGNLGANNAAIHSYLAEEPAYTQEQKRKIVPSAGQKATHQNIINTQNKDVLPPLDILAEGTSQNFKSQTKDELEAKSQELISVLGDFGVKGRIIDVKEGPVVTMYEFEPAAGTKSSRVIGLADDIARSLCAVSTRIAVIPGRNALGIELPNRQRMFFRLKELIKTKEFHDKSIALPLILGKDLAGFPMIADLAKMPHLLVAGTTGSGKSVAINAMIISLLYRYSPQECKMIMIDPKMLELSAYDNIPHLMTPVVTEPAKAVTALKWAVKEMENRYRLMSNLSVRNISGYNLKLQEAIDKGQTLERKIQTGFDSETGKPIHDTVPIEMVKMPFIVVIVDEMADLMLVAGKDIETSIQRLAQMARAAGIHIIMATQRPSVDVITGVIKANFPSRISFKVTSKIDSRTILGEQGSEQLLGMGDMLYMGNSSRILRVHGPFVEDSEVEKVTNFLRTTAAPDYISAVTEPIDDDIAMDASESENDLYAQALTIVKNERKTSISYIQRSLRIGYNRAANLVEELEKNGILSSPNHSGKREVLLPED